MIVSRHAETLLNVVETVDGFLAKEAAPRGRVLPDHEVGLTPNGQQQAEILAEVLKKRILGRQNPDSCHWFLHSPYIRTAETLEAIVCDDEEAKAHTRSHLLLRERDAGFAFSWTVEEVDRYLPWHRAYAKRAGKFYAVSPGGESLAQTCTRIHQFLRALQDDYQGERVFVCSHSRAMLAMLFWLESWPAEEAEALFESPPANCETWRFVWRQDEKGHRHFDRDVVWEDSVWNEFTELCNQRGIRIGTRSRLGSSERMTGKTPGQEEYREPWKSV